MTGALPQTPSFPEKGLSDSPPLLVSIDTPIHTKHPQMTMSTPTVTTRNELGLNLLWSFQNHQDSQWYYYDSQGFLYGASTNRADTFSVFIWPFLQHSQSKNGLYFPNFMYFSTCFLNFVRYIFPNVKDNVASQNPK